MTMRKYLPVILLSSVILAIFLGRALLSAHFDIPHTFDVFDTFTILGSLTVFWLGHHHLRWSDLGLALALGLVIGVEMRFATLYSPYPFLGVVKNSAGQAAIRGIFTFIAVLGGLAVMRQGGPIDFHFANQAWNRAGRRSLIGLGVGLPLAVLNVFAMQLTQGRGVHWQNPLAALANALQPGLVEEIIYRFALWGIFWLILRASLPGKAAWVSGLLAMLVHNFSHLDDLLLQSPLVALGMGAVLALLWGFPPLVLARHKGLEAAIAFHWIQDAARFVAGY